MSNEDESGIAQIDGFGISYGDDGALHHVENGCVFRCGEMNAGVPGLVCADGIPAAWCGFGIFVVSIEQFGEDSAAGIG